MIHLWLLDVSLPFSTNCGRICNRDNDREHNRGRAKPGVAQSLIRLRGAHAERSLLGRLGEHLDNAPALVHATAQRPPLVLLLALLQPLLNALFHGRDGRPLVDAWSVGRYDVLHDVSDVL